MTAHADYHCPMDQLEHGLAALTVPASTGKVVLLVARPEKGVRETPDKVTLTPGAGFPGDKWSRNPQNNPDAEITVMRADVAQLVANGQPISLAGDNLFVNLDLSEANLPAGSRLRAGGALLEVTPLPHTGCATFAARFGRDALRLTADKRFRSQRLRGIHVRVIEPGELAAGDPIEVISRPAAAFIPEESSAV